MLDFQLDPTFEALFYMLNTTFRKCPHSSALLNVDSTLFFLVFRVQNIIIERLKYYLKFCTTTELSL